MERHKQQLEAVTSGLRQAITSSTKCNCALTTQTENGSRALAIDGVQHNKHMLCLSVISLKKSGFKRAF